MSAWFNGDIGNYKCSIALGKFKIGNIGHPILSNLRIGRVGLTIVKWALRKP